VDHVVLIDAIATPDELGFARRGYDEDASDQSASSDSLTTASERLAQRGASSGPFGTRTLARSAKWESNGLRRKMSLPVRCASIAAVTTRPATKRVGKRMPGSERAAKELRERSRLEEREQRHEPAHAAAMPSLDHMPAFQRNPCQR